MTKFLKSNRSDVGLVDRFDLSEIYVQDSRFALSNMLLDPNGLDQIFGLSSDGLTREDIRTSGGLDRPVIHSLAISDVVLDGVNEDLSQQITVDKSVGEPNKHSFGNTSESDNLIIFSGGIAANKIEYNFFDENGEVRTTTVPTSRESLFDSVKNSSGDFTEAVYQGLFRTRRRSHINQIRLDKSLLVEKGIIIESPTDFIKLPIYMRTTDNPNPNPTLISMYATKNSPVVLPVRINSSAKISFSRNSANSSSPPFVFGWEIRRFSDGKIATGQNIDSSGAVFTVNIDINVVGTIAAGTDCLLYVYLDPDAVTKVNLSGIGLKEFLGGQDIGLIGFNNLEELDISNNKLSTVPVWLKTLYSKLKVLNLQDNEFYTNGIISFFDYQDLTSSSISGADTSTPPPNICISQVLGYSGWKPDGNRITEYIGSFSTVQDISGKLYKDLRLNSIENEPLPTVNLQNGFRPFAKLTDLNLGSTIRVVNPDFSKIFPGLQNLTIDRTRPTSAENYWGLIPKLNNNEGLMSIKIDGHEGQVGGSIKYLGDTLQWDSSGVGWNADKAKQFIGQFNIKYFDISRRTAAGLGFTGGICTSSGEVPNLNIDGTPRYHHITSGDVSEAWSGWAASLEELRIWINDIAFNITAVAWNNLRIVNISFCGSVGARNKVFYNSNIGAGVQTATDGINARDLRNIEAWSSGWYGRVFSIENAPRIFRMQLGACDWIGYDGEEGRQYLLPTNFVKPIILTDSSVLEILSFELILNSAGKDLELRSTDLQNLPKLRALYFNDSFITGVFPPVSNSSLSTGVIFDCWLRNCRFRDLSNLGTSINSRVGFIFASNQGTGVGGSLLPIFAPLGSNTSLRYVNFSNSLNSNYPSNWNIVDDRGFVITSVVSGQPAETVTPAGVLWTSRNNNNTSDANSSKLYHNSLGTFFPLAQIMVGDEVIQNQQVIGLVTQIDRNHSFIYLNTSVSITAQSLTFRRRGQNISNYFNNHFSLSQVYLDNCRLVGNIPRFEGCTNLTIVALNNNLLSGYVTGTFENITGVTTGRNTTPALNNFNANNNAFTVSAIRTMISDLHKVAVYFADKNIRINLRVRLLGTKLNMANKQYQNWTREEIFNQTSVSGEGTTIPDSLETRFNQLGPGSLYPGITIEIF
jgi:hypothetical protein